MKTACFCSLLAPLLLAACGSGARHDELATSQTRSQSTPAAVTRPIAIRAISLVDTRATAVRQIIVTISRIDARLVDADQTDDDDAAWTTVSTQTSTVDLLSLQGGTFAALGATSLPANGVDRLRLQIDPFGKNF